MESLSASKNAAVVDRPKSVIRQPVKVHEILGIPKSASKMEQPRSQPVRVKYLLAQMGIHDRPTSDSSVSARRATVAPGTAGKIRRKLYPESAGQPFPDEGATASETQSAGETSAQLHGNFSSHSKPVHLGLSKSDGKAKTNHQRLQPIRPKLLLESWEKSQTVKPQGQKSTARGPRTTNVRRKLYSGYPSLVPPKNVTGKPLPANKLEETVVDTPNGCGKIVKPIAEKSAKAAAARKPTRQSFLLPPNSIRDHHIGRQAKETIAEESPTALSPEPEKITRPEENHPVTKERPEVNVANALEILEIPTSPEAQSTPWISRVADLVVPTCACNCEKRENDRVNTRNLLLLRDNLKQMLKVIEDMIDYNSEPEEEKPLQANTESYISAQRPKNEIEDTEGIAETEAKVAACENESFAEKQGTNRDENLPADPESDKENVPSIGDEAPNSEEPESAGKNRRRSARLAAIEAARSPNNCDNSFSRLESELNIIHAKSKPATPLAATSARLNRLEAHTKRSIREYMMIKSCAKFLQTPDHKGLPTPRLERTAGTPGERRAVERALSRQLLSQLNDLYDDSPE